MSRKIVVIPGDGIGGEITDSAVAVLKKVSEKYNLNLEFETHPAGGTAYDLCGTPLPDETLNAAKAADAVLFGAVGGPKWDSVDPALRPEKAVLGLRKGLGLYANLRPVKVADALVEYSPLKEDIVKGTDILIVRELIGGIYFGDKCESEIHNGAERAWDLENYSVPEVERIVEFAMEAAKKRRNKVTSVDKSGNLFGDILSDEAAVLSGSIGMLPSASIGLSTSLYEPIHGSAPDIAGKGIANPLATILSAAMLLRYSLNEDTAASDIEQAVEKALAQGYRTPDLYKEGFKKADTQTMTQAVLDNIQ